MKYQIDHDYHIHSRLSACSNDPEQSTARILQYAHENGLARVCVTDHYWDSDAPGASSWYTPQNFEHISESKPLPTDPNVKFLFGCETDMDQFFRLGIPLSRFDDFDFVIIPTTHMHMSLVINGEDAKSNARRAELWVARLDALLDMPLPFGKIGIAHLACRLINRESREAYLDTLYRIPSGEMERVFQKAAARGCGIELNQSDMSFADSETDEVLRMFRIAKACGCKFYLGSDAHHPRNFENTHAIFSRAVELLGLTEDDKFRIAGH